MAKARHIEEAGISFGRYRLLEEIGSGGMAVVSRAVVDGPRGFSREIVIKRILREFSSYPSFVRMLATEARLSALLRHPGIVQVHEFGEVEGEFYLAMELVDGSDLRGLTQACTQRGVRLPVGVASYIIDEVAGALAYAHTLTDDEGRALGIVHRDVSPSNVMVTPVGSVKLLDFGIAHAEDHIRDDQTRTTVGSLKGKLSYLSPEQADGRPVDARSDIFSLGIVFHEMLTGKRLFRGNSELETMRMIRECEVTPPGALVEGISEDVDAVVGKMLARKPGDRYQSCEEVLTALTPIVRRLQGDGAALRRFLRELGPIGRLVVATAPTPPNHAASRSRSSSLRGSYGEAKPITRVPMNLPAALLHQAKRLLSGPRAAFIGISVGVVATAALMGVVSFRQETPLTIPGTSPAMAATLPSGAAAPAAAPLAAAPGAAAPGAATAAPGAATAAPAAAAPAAAAATAMAPATNVATVSNAATAAAAATPEPALPAAMDPEPTPPPAARPAAAPATAPRSAAAPSPVRFSVTGTEGAEVVVDGVLVGTVPLSITLPTLSGARHVVVRRSGFKRYSTDVDGAKDAALVAPLDRAAPRRAPTAPAPPTRSLLKDPFR